VTNDLMALNKSSKDLTTGNLQPATGNQPTFREDIIKAFDPNGPGVIGNLFGLPFTPENAQLVIIPVPWEVTVSYHTGTLDGPAAILKASSQIDHGLRDIPDAWKLGVSLQPVDENLKEESLRLRQLASKHIEGLECGKQISEDDPIVVKINEACENLNIFIKSSAKKLLRKGKMVGLLGGDHSTSLGFIRALAERHDDFGILQIDAHADLRKAYEGFTYSHASAMFNALKTPGVERLVQVGIRDYCEEELNVIQNAGGRVKTFFDQDIKRSLYAGKTWDHICDLIIKELPAFVYISFDIDGLDPKLCPHTGTPVPGGFEFEQAIYLIRKLVAAGKRIIGFDLVEVAPGANDWDANVGARLLYQLANWMAVSNGKLKAVIR
jgi:agmatinase